MHKPSSSPRACIINVNKLLGCTGAGGVHTTWKTCVRATYDKGVPGGGMGGGGYVGLPRGKLTAGSWASVCQFGCGRGWLWV